MQRAIRRHKFLRKAESEKPHLLDVVTRTHQIEKQCRQKPQKPLNLKTSKTPFVVYNFSYQ
jgi:hypothetical protein